ncbi:tRNA lysidine(34) synthetase TilS [Arcanobacterium buesumense]|uniref:tRNA(Ile)-lysidine synthase n=1 Tax=Arcanobacterium buesumense TaxID=2722751 RepID=A0A6H2EJF4_9ACTO|nr:tRNA lysidine(34) synthetase TilS [Arcanobacterium buesumense]QJC21274.1 tRNA lysidine(34) synthetase TilS [Arcanobacterium buesumense]
MNTTRIAVREALTEHPAGVPVIVGVSGGSDSMALAATVAFVAPKLGIPVHAVCVDHRLRPESAAEARFVVDELRSRGVIVHVARVAVSGELGPEGNARVARYDAIAGYARELGTARQPASVLLGHTLNDQAETVLLGFSRGSGAKSIAGMPARGHLPLHSDVPMLRPLLGFNRQELRVVCRETKVEWIEDPSNDIDGPWRCADGSALRRSAVRHNLLPLMEDILGPGTIAAISRTAGLLQDDNQALEFYARAEFDRVVLSRNPLRIDCLSLAPVPQAVRRRVLKYAIEESGVRSGELVYWHIARLDKLVTDRKNNSGLDLPGLRVTRESHQLRFESGAQSRHHPHGTSNPVTQAPMEDT